jgi:hypothetical protein
MGDAMSRIAPLIVSLILGSATFSLPAGAGEVAKPAPRVEPVTHDGATQAQDPESTRAAMITLLLMLARERGIGAPATSSQAPASR